MSPSPAIFLDRDGVILHNRKDYVRTLEQARVYPRALRALARLSRGPFKIVVVTNQAGIGKGLIDPAVVEAIHAGLRGAVEAEGGRIDGFFLCPHTVEASCACRKPRPGLLLEAARVLDLDLGRSYLVGDALSDIEAGQRAGVRQSILVLTGRGNRQQSLPARDRLAPFHIAPDLLAAARAIENMEKKAKIGT